MTVQSLDALGKTRAVLPVPGNYLSPILSRDGKRLAVTLAGDIWVRLIGEAVWHVQYLEDVLVSFLIIHLLHERRCAGEMIAENIAKALLAEKREKLTIGPLIDICRANKIIRPDQLSRFETFKAERHWLVHRSVVESGDDLYLEATRAEVFSRIDRVKEEAIALKKIVDKDQQAWFVRKCRVDIDKAKASAEKAIRELEGASTSLNVETPS